MQINQLFFRRLWGSVARQFSPGLGYCYHCRRPWNVCKWHSTKYYEGEDYSAGCFPLCETCWNELSPQDKLPYYKRLIMSWQSNGEPDHDGLSWDNLWETLEANVLAGK